MKHEDHKRALKLLKSINKLTLKGPTKKIKSGPCNEDTYRTEYKNQFIHLDEMTMVVSGTIENFYSNTHRKESTFLTIAMYDENNEDMGVTTNQLHDYKKTLKTLISA